MYGKRLLTLVLAFIGAFVLFMVLSFYLYPIFNPIDDDSDMEGFDLGEFYEYNYLEFGPAAIIELRKEITELEEELAILREKEEQDMAIIDSLFQANLELENEIARTGGGALAGANGQFAAEEVDMDEQTQQVARSLLRLDIEELRPIVNRLSDNQIVDIYRSSSNLQREQLLRALEPAKAATLLRNVLS